MLEAEPDTFDDEAELAEDQRRQLREERAPYLPAPGPTAIAARVRSLKSSVFSVAEKRERLPQQLFWSLFHSEVNEIKKRKERQRLFSLFS